MELRYNAFLFLPLLKWWKNTSGVIVRVRCFASIAVISRTKLTKNEIGAIGGLFVRVKWV
jgi:hypothetical protein